VRVLGCAPADTVCSTGGTGIFSPFISVAVAKGDSAMDAAALKSPCLGPACGIARQVHSPGDFEGAILAARGAEGKPEKSGRHMARSIAPQLPWRNAIFQPPKQIWGHLPRDDTLGPKCVLLNFIIILHHTTKSTIVRIPNAS